MKMKISNIIFIILVFIVIAMPITFINKQPNKISERENRYLTNFPTVSITNLEFREQFNSWLNDNIGFRDSLLDIRTTIMLNALNIVTSDRVYRGKDGWWYYTLDENLKIATGEYTLTTDILEEILQNHLKIRDKLLKKGIEYIIILPTSKVSIYPEYLGFGNGKITTTPVDVVADYLETHSDLKIIRLKQTLINAKDKGQVYFKSDTHWTYYGANIAYQKIISDMNLWGLCDTKSISVKYEEGTYKGEFSQMLGNSNAIAAEATTYSVISNPSAIKDNQTQRYGDIMRILENRGHQLPWYYYINKKLSKSPSVMLFGDSMAGSWNFTESLAENFSEFLYIWSYDIYEELVDYVKPNVVIYEMTERFLNSFPQKNIQFLAQPLEDYNAKIISYNIVEDNLIVEVKNTSNSIWSNKENIKCCLLFNDGQDWGIRALIEKNTKIAPGEIVEFIFNGISQLNYNTAEIQMCHEGICYFGEKAKIGVQENNEYDAEIISTTCPLEVNHTDTYNFDITVKNTGISAWKSTDNIKLCIWQDYTDWGYRILIPDDIKVNPGEEYTFTLEDFVLPQAAQTTLEFQMLIEGIQYFGEKKPVHIIAK